MIVCIAGMLRPSTCNMLYHMLCFWAGGFPVVLNNLWLGADEGEAVASALVPKLQKTKVAVEQLLFEVATLEVRSAGIQWARWVRQWRAGTVATHMHTYTFCC